MRKRMLRGWQGPKPGWEVGGGEGGQEGGGMRRDRWQQGGGVSKGATGRWRWGGEQQGRKGSGSGKWDNVEGRNGEQWGEGGGGDGKGAMGRGKWKEVGWGGGEEGGRRKKEDSQIDMMGCLGGHRLKG